MLGQNATTKILHMFNPNNFMIGLGIHSFTKKESSYEITCSRLLKNLLTDNIS